MSNALAIAAVTKVLKDLLDNGMIDLEITSTLGTQFAMSALSPDMVPLEGPDAGPRLNLFLHQVTPNAGWRNVDLPSRSANGNRLTNPPLALDLHYLLTAYGVADLQAEVLLGYGMQLLHENPVLTRDAIRRSLNLTPVSGEMLPPIYQALQSADLAEQMELLKIIPMAMPGEEMSRLWSALHARYRLTAAFQVSVVLIESQLAASSPLPVLTRGRRVPNTERDAGVSVLSGLVPPYPALQSILADSHHTPSTVQLGDTVTIRGQHLAGTSPTIVLRSSRFAVSTELTPVVLTSARQLSVTIPTALATLPAGLYQLEYRVTQEDTSQVPPVLQVRTSNALPVALAPKILSPTGTVTTGVDAPVLTVGIDCSPPVRAGQSVELMLDSRSAPALAFTDGAVALEFQFVNPPPAASSLLMRLKVDGVESISINRSVRPAAFLDGIRIEVPA